MNALNRNSLSIFCCCVAAILVPCCSAAAATAGLDYIHYSDGQWLVEQVETAGYELLSAYSGDHALGARQAGGLYALTSQPSSAQQVNSFDYTAVACGYATEGFAARSANGLDYVHHDGTAWQTRQVNTNSYAALAAVDWRAAYGARRGGGLDYCDYDHAADSWTTTSLSSSAYAAVCQFQPASSTCDPGCAAALSEGGLELFWRDSQDDQWYTEHINDNCYASLVWTTPRSPNPFEAFRGVPYGLCARAEGGLDFVHYGGLTTGWVTDTISTNTYLAIGGWLDAGRPRSRVLGLRDTGAVDFITYDDSQDAWTITQVANGPYVALGVTPRGIEAFASRVPEPATLSLLAAGGLLALRRRRNRSV